MNFLGQRLLDSFFGPIVRQIPDTTKTLYLTFDDGPAESTSEVLDLLTELNVQATFFLVGAKIQANLEVLKDIQSRGHSVGNHSYDHTYKPFIKGRMALLDWIQKSEEVITEYWGHPTVGFRPPNGITTPELKWALNKVNLPLILWKIRFFDKAIPWTPAKAIRSLLKTQSGDIILLHDMQSCERLPLFLKTLRLYILEARERSFQFQPLTRELCESAKNKIGDKNA